MSKKICFLVVFSFFALMITGCSHNAGVITFGKTFRIGGGEYGGLLYVNGLSVIDVSRENSKMELEVDDEAGLAFDAATNTLRGIKKIKFQVGKQVSGYLVDLAGKDRKLAEKYLDSAD